MKIILYSSISFALFLLYLGLMIVYVPIASSITAIVGLIILGLLFYEIYKKYSLSSKAKYLLIFFVIFWTALFISQIEYIPSQNITVRDVFGNSLENIPVNFIDEVGTGNGGHTTLYRVPKPSYYLTDSQGKVETKARFYFGQRKARSTYGKINNEVYENGSSNIIARPNLRFDVKTLISYENKREISLSPIKIDYQKCNSISNQENKSECL